MQTEYRLSAAVNTVLRKGVTLFLIAIFVFSPVSNVIAQETQSSVGDTQPPQTSQYSLSIPGTDQSGQTQSGQSESGQDNPGNPDQLEALDSFGADNLPTIPNSNPFSYQFSLVGVDGQSGAFTQKIQIDVPPGRNSIQPDVALNYNSQNTEDGIVGYGWSISIPYIQRLNKTGSQNLYNQDYFTSSFDGELASSSATSTGSYGAKFENGSFNAYTFKNNAWVMYDKKGTKYTFGLNDQAQQNAAASSSRIYRWMLEEVRDTNDNYMRYVYAKNDGQIYPSQIVYTGNGSADGPFTISFSTSTRTDLNISYKAGFKVTTNYKISKITASISGSAVREYNLSYTTGNNGYRSLLSSVQQNGYDASHVIVSYPASTFSYVSSSTAFARSNALYNSAYIPADANGDSFSDTNVFENFTGSYNARVWSKGNTAAGPTVTSVPEFWAAHDTDCAAYKPYENGTRYVDTNADGKADLIRGDYNYTWHNRTQEFFLNTYSTSTGYGWASTTPNGTIPEFMTDGDASIQNLTTGFFGEVNGDGLPDYVERTDDSTLSTDGAYLGNGSTWAGASTTIFWPLTRVPLSASTMNYDNSQLVDINGDGMDDWVHSDSSNTYVNLNTGSGWDPSADSHWTLATSTLFKSPGTNVYYDRGMRFVDINGDGLSDFIRSYVMSVPTTNLSPNNETGGYYFVYLNTGSGWATSSISLLSDVITNPQVPSGVWGGIVCHSEYANWDGSGQNVQDVLTDISFSNGATSTITYKKTAEDGNNIEMPISLLTVSKVVTNDGLGNLSEKKFSYSGGRMYVDSGIRDRRFAGFAISNEIDAGATTTTYFSQGDSVGIPIGEQSDGFGQINHPFKVIVRDANNQLLKQTFYRWDSATTSNRGIFTYRAREVTQDYGFAGAHKDTAIDYVYSTTTGEVTQKTEYGEVVGASDGTFSDTESDKRTTTITYAASSTLSNMALPSDISVVDASSTKIRQTRNYYDSLSLGSMTKGNQTRQDVWTTGSTYYASTKSYTAYGLVATSTDTRGKSIAYKYDSLNLYPATTTYPLSQTTQSYYDYSTGKARMLIDRNGYVSSTEYDGFGRPVTEKQPNSATPSTLSTTTVYVYSDTGPVTSIHKTDYLSTTTPATIQVDTYSYFDGLKRPLQDRKTTETSDTYAVRDYAYDNLGLKYKESLPYFSSGSARSGPTGTATLYTTYLYDGLKRVSTTTNAIGSVQNSYDAWTTIVTDPLSNQKKYYNDAFGNLKQVDEINGASTYSTYYTWNGNNKLTKITDADGNIRNFTYDGLGQRLTAQDLHNSSDATFGSWTYVYNATGQLATSTDPRGVTVNYLYDDQGRPSSEDYTGTAVVDVSYSYDSCTNGIGRLCTSKTLGQSTNATTTYGYDALGRTTQEDKTIGTSAYTTRYDYDQKGNPVLITYPDSSQVKYTYNNAGLIEKVSQLEAGNAFTDIITDFDYSPTEQVAYTAFKNGMATTRTYDATQLYRLTHLVTEFVGGVGGEGNDEALLLLESAFASSTEEVATSTEVEMLETDQSSTTPQAVEDVETQPEEPIVLAENQTEATTTSEIVDTATSSEPLAVDEQLAIDPISLNTQKADMAISVGLDEKSHTPVAHIDNWGETGFSIAPVVATPVVSARNEEGKAIWQFADREVRFYELPAQETVPEGGLEIDAVFSQKPTSNIVEFAIDSENLEFLYQPPLNQEQQETDVSNCTATQCLDSEGNLVVERPEHIVGSYAAYYKNGIAGDYSAIGGKNYKTGKAFHIFRPRISDSASSTTWGELNIDTDQGTLKVTIPQEFLDHAVYPVVVDPTFGYGRIGTTVATTTNGVGSKYTISQSGQVTSISQYIKSASGTIQVAAALYADNAGTASGALLTSQSATASIGTTAGWATTSVSQYLVASGTVMWIWGLGDASRIIYYDSGSTNQYNVQGVTFPGWPDPMVPGTYFNRKLSMYATYNAIATTIIQDQTYTYDAVGNITRIVDASPTATAKTTDYTYDALYRMTHASTTNATSGDYKYTYTHSPVGNLLSSTPNGYFQYTGTTTSNYANPHAATVIGTTTFAFDAAGDVTSSSAGFRVTPNYRGMIANMNSYTGSATTTFAYDVDNSRIRVAYGTNDVYYPNKFYNTSKSGINANKHVFAGDSVIATITGTSTAAQIQYIHPDHLGSTNVISDATSSVVELLDYYPYGNPKTDTKSGSFSEQRKYIGQEYDPSTNISYLNARYYEGSRGQFLSQDPVFWEVGQTKTGVAILQDPQLLNSYSYARNNPINGKDADGRLVELVSRPIGGPLGSVGAHAFIAIAPENPQTIGSIPNVNMSRNFTLGGYTDAPSQFNLYKQANDSVDYSYGFQGNTYGMARVTVAPPNGMSQEAFEAGLVNSYNSLPGTISENGYGLLGQRRISNNPNSNNTATSILMGAGVSSSQINNYQTQLFSQNFRATPGLGTSVSATTYGQSLGNTLGALKGALTQLLSIISSKK